MLQLFLLRKKNTAAYLYPQTCPCKKEWKFIIISLFSGVGGSYALALPVEGQVSGSNAMKP